MTVPEFVAPFVENGVVEVVIAGVAFHFHGGPRFARDIYLVLVLHRARVRDIEGALERAGFCMRGQQAKESEVEWAGAVASTSPIATMRPAGVSLAGNDLLHAWALERRLGLDLEALQIWIAPLEYVILGTLQHQRISESD